MWTTRYDAKISEAIEEINDVEEDGCVTGMSIHTLAPTHGHAHAHFRVHTHAHARMRAAVRTRACTYTNRYTRNMHTAQVASVS